MLEPIRVRPTEDGETFIIIFGERRWRAARIAGLTTIPCTIAEGAACDPKAVAAAQLSENIHRKSLTALETANALETYATEYNLTGKELAASTGLSQTYISRHRGLLKAEGPAKQALEEKYLLSTDVYALFCKLNERDQMRLLRQARKDKLPIPRAVLAHEVANAQGRKARETSATTEPGSAKKQPDMIYLPCITQAQCVRLFQRLRLPEPPQDHEQIASAFLQALGDALN